MNPGPALIPFVTLLGYCVARRPHLLLGLTTFLYLVLPTARNKYGPVSLYLCDISALALMAASLLHPSSCQRVLRLHRWYIALTLSLTVGFASALLRYGALLEPGYTLLRFCCAFSPLIALAQSGGDPRWLASLSKGVTWGALSLGAIAIAQSASPEAAIRLEAVLYGAPAGVTELSADLTYRERLVLTSETLRAYGPYGSSTCFAGAGALAGAVLATLTALYNFNSPLTHAGLCSAAIATILTYSRHGILAWAILTLISMFYRPRRVVQLAMLALALTIVAAPFVELDFLRARLDRGFLEDDNIRARLVTRPLELIDRIQFDPTVAILGAGLGLGHIDRSGPEAPSTYGYVSNGFLLYLFHSGILALATVLYFFAASFWRALHLRPQSSRLAAIAAVACVSVIIASDNYSFHHPTFPFGWSIIFSLIFTKARIAAPCPPVTPTEWTQPACSTIKS